MSTDAKRAGNARYLAKMKTLTIRMKPEEYVTIQAAANRTGDSVQGYILQAIRTRIEQEGQPLTLDPPAESSGLDK